MKNEAIKRLLEKDKNALRAVHDLVRIDFEKPYAAFVIESRFTANMITKQAGEQFKKDSIICVLTYGGDHCFKDEIYFSTLNLGVFDINYKPRYEYNKKRCFVSKYYSRKDFEAARKANEFSIIICQKNEYLTEENKHSADVRDRFKVTDIRRYTYKGRELVGEVYTTRTDDNGSRYIINERGFYYNSYREFNSIDEVIDKSGYITYIKRDQLKQAARKLRADREKAAFIANDYTQEVQEIKAKAEAKKADIVQELANATTDDELRTISKKLDVFRGLSGVYSAIARLEKNTAEKAFSSIESYRRAANDIINALAAL